MKGSDTVQESSIFHGSGREFCIALRFGGFFMTKVIAHRGARKRAPQNTIPAFVLAKEMGADGFENDVHFTADGRIVVCHDYAVDETSSGEGRIAEMTFEELRSFDFGAWFAPEFEGTLIPTLEEFFEVSRGMEIINVEIKRPLDKNYDIVPAVIDMARDMGVYDSLLISSFDEEVLRKAYEYDAGCETAFLYDFRSSPDHVDEILADPVAYAKTLHASAIHPVIFFVDEDVVKNAHANGMKVNVWTVNETDTMDLLIDIECDGIITDVPDLCLERIKLKAGQ